MSAFSYRVGRPAEDAMFLISGFSDPHRTDRECWRNCAKVFRLRVPVAAAGRTRVTLRMRVPDPALRVAVHAGEAAVGEIAPEDAQWHDYALELSGGGPVATLTGRADREPYWPPFPKADPNRAFVDLTRVTAEAVDGGELEVPEAFTRPRIARAPVRLVNLRRSRNPVRRPAPPAEERRVLFGDLHVHTNYSLCGHPDNGTIDENVAAARERGHDFIALTDHAEHMDLDAWKRYFEEIEAASARHDIPIIRGVEWTSRDHGHRNIYFLQPHPPFVDYFMFESNHPSKLGAFFTDRGLDAFAVPHHFPYVFQSGNIESICPDVEPLMEIYSGWGSSECYGARLQDTNRVMPGCTVRDALARGLKLGFVGGGDAHNNLPGDGGVTAILAPEPTVEALFDALRRRLCYATSGARIGLDVTLNGYPAGSVLTVNQYAVDRLFPLALKALAVGETALDRLEIVSNGEVVYSTSHRQGAAGNEINLALEIKKLATPTRRTNELDQQLVNHSRYYYARAVQCDGGTAWSSPIWVDFRFDYD